MCPPVLHEFRVHSHLVQLLLSHHGLLLVLGLLLDLLLHRCVVLLLLLLDQLLLSHLVLEGAVLIRTDPSLQVLVEDVLVQHGLEGEILAVQFGGGVLDLLACTPLEIHVEGALHGVPDHLDLLEQLLCSPRVFVDDALGGVDVELNVLAFEQALEDGVIVEDVLASVLFAELAQFGIHVHLLQHYSEQVAVGEGFCKVA